MAKKRVVVTGMGVVSCFGSDVDTFYDALLAGKSGVGPITYFDCSEYPTQFAGEVRDISYDGYIDKKQARRVDPFIRYSMVAGKKALEMAGIEGDTLAALDHTKAGVVIGSGMGGMNMYQDGCYTLKEKGMRRISPFFVPYIITNMAGALLSIDLGFRGPNYSISTACATANHSIIAAAEHIRKGDADVMVCGGTEAPILPIGLSGFVACKALSQRNDAPEKASRPFDKDRDGFVMGEGAGVLVLEEYEHAKRRGANILCEYLGGAVNCDAHHITEPLPDGKGVSECMHLALKDAGLACEQINHINAHATSTQAGDMCEVYGIKEVFGRHAEQLVMSCTKSITGHCLGAAGGIEAIATIQAIRSGRVHPTINLDRVEEDVAPLHVPTEAHTMDITAAMSNSFGFGGHNATLIFGPQDA